MPDKSALLKEISEVSFVLNDITLYLDTHPECKEGIAYFNEMAPRHAALLKEFAENFEPLTVDCCCKNGSVLTDHFTWPDGEMAVSMRYLSQRYSMPCKKTAGLLTDIGMEELAHMEMICAMIYQLTKDMKIEDVKTSGFDAYYVDHTSAVWPMAPGGIPFNACEFQSKGDAITDLTDDLAQNKRPGPLMIICCALSPIPMFENHFSFSVPESLSIFRGSARHWEI